MSNQTIPTRARWVVVENGRVRSWHLTTSAAKRAARKIGGDWFALPPRSLPMQIGDRARISAGQVLPA